MKKIMIFLLVMLSVVVAKSQTHENNISRINESICDFQNKLNGTKDKIYYLEITLNSKISKLVEDSVKTVGKKRSLLFGLGNLEKLRKEQYFSKDELVILYNQKTELEKTITELKETVLNSEKSFTKININSKIPEQMGRLEYERRTRAQMFKNSEEILNGEVSIKTYPGLLINWKIGRGETTTFTITRVGFPEFKPIINNLGPEEQLDVLLPIGTYRVEVVCGSFRKYVTCDVDPRIIKHVSGRNVYWFVCKTMSDF